MLASPARAQQQLAPGSLRFDRGRFTVVAYPPDAPLARSLLADATARDTFPGLPRPAARVVIVIAPDRASFRQLAGPGAPEWGAALAFPESNRILLQGSRAGSDAGEPRSVLRHELAHLALHERLGELPSRWFDEGYASYAAGEWGRDETLATNLALIANISPTLDGLDDGFLRGSTAAEGTYALAYRAVADLAALDPARGLTLFFEYWRETHSFDRAVRSAFGITGEAFEKRWRAQTRRRYGAIAVFADVTVATLLLLVVLVPLWVMRRRRDGRRLEALRAADAVAEQRALEERAVIDALLGEVVRDADAGGPTSLDMPAGPV